MDAYHYISILYVLLSQQFVEPLCIQFDCCDVRSQLGQNKVSTSWIPQPVVWGDSFALVSLHSSSYKRCYYHCYDNTYICNVYCLPSYRRVPMFSPYGSVLCMRSKAWLAARVSLRLARLPRTASSAQRSRRLRSTHAAAPVLLAHADVTKT